MRNLFNRSVAVILCVLMLLTAVPAGAANDDEASNAGLFYREINGEIAITGYDESAGGNVIIPPSIDGKPVTSIGESAFSRCTGLTSIIIPDSVTSIGTVAFGNCSRLTSIVIPDSVTSIGNYAFLYCTSLTSITMSDAIESVSSNVFFEHCVL